MDQIEAPSRVGKPNIRDLWVAYMTHAVEEAQKGWGTGYGISDI